MSSLSSAKAYSPRTDDVCVKSVIETETKSKISIESAKKIKELLARLESTHLQVDEYSRKRTKEISEAVAESIKKVIDETKSHEKQLLTDAKLRTAEIEKDFKRKLEEYVTKLDTEKAAVLVKLEKELDVRQELILESARKRIDDLDEEAKRLKLGVLKDAKDKTSEEIKKLTEKVSVLGKEDASRRLESTTKTVITTKSACDDETVKVDKTKKVESSKSPSDEYRRK